MHATKNIHKFLALKAEYNHTVNLKFKDAFSDDNFFLCLRNLDKLESFPHLHFLIFLI